MRVLGFVGVLRIVGKSGLGLGVCRLGSESLCKWEGGQRYRIGKEPKSFTSGRVSVPGQGHSRVQVGACPPKRPLAWGAGLSTASPAAPYILLLCSREGPPSFRLCSEATRLRSYQLCSETTPSRSLASRLRTCGPGPSWPKGASRSYVPINNHSIGKSCPSTTDMASNPGRESRGLDPHALPNRSASPDTNGTVHNRTCPTSLNAN